MDAKVFSVIQVYLGFTKNIPPSMILGASGTVPTSGWSNGRLVPRIYIAPPADGIWDFDFIASPPVGPALQVFSTIVSEPFVAEVPAWFKGARIHSSINALVKNAGEDSSITLTQFAATSGGADAFPWKTTNGGGTEVFPWVAPSAPSSEADGLPTSATVLGGSVQSLLGMVVRTHRVSDLVTQDFQANRVNLVLADEKPILVRVYVG